MAFLCVVCFTQTTYARVLMGYLSRQPFLSPPGRRSLMHLPRPFDGHFLCAGAARKATRQTRTKSSPHDNSQSSYGFMQPASPDANALISTPYVLYEANNVARVPIDVSDHRGIVMGKPSAGEYLGISSKQGPN